MLPFSHAKKFPSCRGPISLRSPSHYVAALPLGSPRRLCLAKATTHCNSTAIRGTRDLSRDGCRHTARKLIPGPHGIFATNHVDSRPTRAPAPQCLGSRDEHARRDRQNQRGVAHNVSDGRQQGGYHRQFRHRRSALLTPIYAVPASINPCHMSTAQLKLLLPSAIGGT
jgi:hypothetical protein